MSTVFLVIVIGCRGVGREVCPCATREQVRRIEADAAAVGRHAITVPVTEAALRDLWWEVAA